MVAAGIRTSSSTKRRRTSDAHSAVMLIAACLLILAFCSNSVAAPQKATEGAADTPAATETAATPDEAPQNNEKPAEPVEDPFPNRVKAPENILDGGVEWLNTSGEIRLKDLRGKIVLLDFWTYCCINCMHVLPELKYLEQKYPNELVVIGVHSAKFDNEKDSDNIRRAIVRYEIEHPVVNDADMVIWRKFGTRAWPTIAVIDPEGNYLGSQSGEGTRELFEVIINRLITYHKANGTLDSTPIRFDLESNRVKGGALKFPAKVLADPVGKRLLISDSNHNRIVIAGLDGKLIDVIGSGRIGSEDGGFDDASFDHPQGMELVGDTLYVADTENHLIRAIDLTDKLVTTLSGTGKQARTRRAGGPLLETALNSPWAIVHVDGTLYIAMAGPHQIWSHKIGSDSIKVFAGSGREDVINGRLETSAFAQPSGIVTDREFMYVVDSEGSAVRKVPVDPSGTVSTLVGTSELPRGQSLFAFGDKDGVGDEARLQHPIGIAIDGDTLYVADSYNHKIRKIDLKTNNCTTYLGNGKPGDSLTQLSEPSGLTVLDGHLFVADTNNHRILKINLEDGKAVPFEVAGLTAPGQPKVRRADSFDAGDAAESVAAQKLSKGAKEVPVEIGVLLPEGYKLNKEAPVTFRVKAVDGEIVADGFRAERHEAAQKDEAITLTLPVAEDVASGTVQLAVTYMYCRAGTGGLCKVQTDYWTIPLKREEGAKDSPIKLRSSP